uniref:Lipocalin n=1 Tax=Rhipicephalus zambeziensis TaxID=60191 RepID=A0A224YA57_9ACAR
MFKRTVILVLAVFVGVNEARTLDIYQAVNTTGKTYVYSTLTPSKSNTCTYYKKPTISCLHGNCFYYFHYHETTASKKPWWDYGEIQKPCREPKYSKHSCLLRMDISTYKTTGEVDEPERKVLMSWHENPGCGVYIVLVNNKKAGCELHVRHKALKNTKHLKTCEDDLNKHCKTEIKHTHYLNSCRNYANS